MSRFTSRGRDPVLSEAWTMTALTWVTASLVALLAYAVWRGRQVAIALAGAECPDCRVPLIRLEVAAPHGAVLGTTGHGPMAQVPPTWEVHACPSCDRVVTTVKDVPSPVAECPSCRQPSLVVYAERATGGIDGLAGPGDVIVDEWCDLCGRRVRTTVVRPEHERTGLTHRALRPAGPQAGRSDQGRADQARAKAPDLADAPARKTGQVLPFRGKQR